MRTGADAGLFLFVWLVNKSYVLFAIVHVALVVAPILSNDQTLLYQAGVSSELYCIDAETGDILWIADGAFRSSILTEPRLVELLEETKLFVIEGMKGKVRQHDAQTGVVDWAFDCQAVSDIPCNDAVEADFRYEK